jgi:hypothetical protein
LSYHRIHIFFIHRFSNGTKVINKGHLELFSLPNVHYAKTNTILPPDINFIIPARSKTWIADTYKASSIEFYVSGTFADGTQFKNGDPSDVVITYNSDNQTYNVKAAFTIGTNEYTIDYTGDISAYDALSYKLLTLDETRASDVDPDKDKTINLAFNTPIFADYTASQGWWQVIDDDTNEKYSISLSNLSRTTVDGTYTLTDLDLKYSYITRKSDKKRIAVTDANITATTNADGSIDFIGTIVGSNGGTYNINIHYKKPVATTTKNVTVDNAKLEDFTASKAFRISGVSADGIAPTITINSDKIAGEYTNNDILINLTELYDGTTKYSIYETNNIKVVDNGDGAYTLTCDMLCYGDILYHITMNVPSTTGISSAKANENAATKTVRKYIKNGKLVIQHGDKLYNEAGVQIAK